MDKSLVHVSTSGWITMHCLLQQLGKQIVYGQSDEPGKRQFLEDAEEIRDVLENETVSSDMYRTCSTNLWLCDKSFIILLLHRIGPRYII